MSDSSKHGRASYVGSVLLLVVLVGLAALWHFTPVGQWADPRLLADVVQPLGESWWSAPIVIVGFVFLSVIAFPANILILAMGFVFGALWGSLLAMVGCMLSASISYGVGSALGHEKVSRIAGGRAETIDRWVAKRGVWSVILVRVVPLAPFGVVNLVIGGSRIPLRDFIWGTLIGMTPGIVLKGFFGDELADFLVDPELFELVILLAIVAIFIVTGFGVRRFIVSKQGAEAEPEQGLDREEGVEAQQRPTDIGELTQVEST